METVLPPQVFIRNQKGVVWGPLAPETVELLIDNGVVKGQVQVSWDGVNFAYPGRFPELREFFPRELWGDADAASAAADAAHSAPTPVPFDPSESAGTASAQTPMAGPGAIAAAARPTTAPVMAGPGARAAADPRIHTSRPSMPAVPHPPPAPARAPAPRAVAPAAVPPKPPPAPAPSAPSPPIESLAAPPASGDLAALSPVHLYYLAASADGTGRLRFKLSDRSIEIHFRKGNPEHVDSDHPEDSLGGFLVKQGLATPDQLVQAEAQKGRFGGELIGALFGMAVLNPSTAFAQLTQRAQSILLKALLAEAGTFIYENMDLPPQKAMPLGNRWGVLTETVRRVPTPELQRRLRGALDLPVMKSGGRVAVTELRLTPRETRALSFIDGVRSLNQLAQEMPAEQENFLRVAFLLQQLEAVSFAAVPVQEAAKPPPRAPAPAPQPVAPQTPRITAQAPIPPGVPVATPPVATAVRPSPAHEPPKITAAVPVTAPPRAVPAAPRPATSAPAASAPTPAPVLAPSAPAPDPVAELPHLRALEQKMRTQNHFEVLGVSEKADGAAVKAAYFRLAKVHHPDTVLSGAPAEFAKLKEQIFAAIGEANRRLSDDKSRAEYLDELKHGAEKVDVAKIFAAEEMFQKACILVKAKKFTDAVTMLDQAIKANGEEGEFYAWRGYARFFTFKEKSEGLIQAVRDIQIALRKNERCAQAHYFHGSMARLVGDIPTAQKELKLALLIQPDHIDAQREARMLAGKK